ncbi:MAG: ParB N-terminal domain-containing protein [Alphaproteobacteria bacterium]|nr:ParB N-terminal domain-containing protein [Alphaproteobacteria bacterium]
MSGKIEQIAITSIEIGTRIRGLGRHQVEVLKETIARQGILQPVTIRRQRGGNRPFRLISGWHRIAAAEALGHQEVPAVVADVTAAQAGLMEVDENLGQGQMFPIDKAALVAARLSHWQAIHPARRGGDRKSAEARKSKVPSWHFDIPEQNQGFTSDKKIRAAAEQVAADFGEATAAAVGLSRRHVYRLLAIHRRLRPNIHELIYSTPPKIYTSINQLYRLSKETPDIQALVLAACRDKQLTTVSAGVRVAMGRAVPRPDPMMRFETLWASMTRKQRAKVLARLKPEFLEWEKNPNKAGLEVVVDNDAPLEDDTPRDDDGVQG